MYQKGDAIDPVGIKNAADTTVNPATEDTVIAQATFDHGRKSSISTSAVQMTTVSFSAVKGVLVVADKDNSGKVYVGNSDVTADTTDATDGIELNAGDAVVIPVDNPNKIYIIGSASGQKVFWLAT